MEETFSDAEEPLQTLPYPTLDEENDFHGVEAEDYAMEDVDEILKFNSKPSNEAKIRELLRNISSIEVKLCADGSKEFMKLLRDRSGGELLYDYVRSSSKFTELLEAWNRWRGKPGMYYILSLISVILGHPDGKYRPNDSNRVVVSRVLDKFSRSIVEEKLEDIYKELNSKEGKRQKAALSLIGSIVRRGSLLAAEVAKSFDFKLPLLPKLSEYRKKQANMRKKHSTRGAFVEFALSFLEAGKPGLLRWILQQREIFSGILRGLGNDDDETVVYVLSTLRDRVLTPESLVPPSLRSVLFGSATLEQLAGISARGDSGLAAKVAYEVLVMVCTDPSNGLMPDSNRQPSPLKGNHKRLLDLMKKLRANEIRYHQDLLLAVVNGRPSLASSYLEEFPYNLEDNASPTWLSAVTLAANVIRSVRIGISWDFLARHTNDQLNFESPDVQSVFKCVCSRPFSRLVINKGLLHSDPLIKYGTLRLLLEALKLLNAFIDALSMNRLSSLKQKVQDEVRVLLPDPQVLVTLLSSVSSTYQNSRSALKRSSDSEKVGHSKPAAAKKIKIDVIVEDIDIIVGGLNSDSKTVFLGETEEPKEVVTSSHFDDVNNHEKLVEVWGSDDYFSSDDVKDAEVYFYCKVLEAVKIFHVALPAVLEVSYDFLKILPSNPMELPSILLQSFLSMLIEHLGCSQDFSSNRLPPIYKHLQSFLNLSMQSSFRSIKGHAYVLAKAAIRSTGAFDHNPWEIGAWLLFLPVDVVDENCSDEEGESFQSLSMPLVSFLCDAISTVGNNLFKYWALLKCHLSNIEFVKDQKVNFSPLIICVMEKCVRLLRAESGTFKLPEKSMISLYVCNTLKYLLQTQVEAKTLAAVIHQFLLERISDHIGEVAVAHCNSCEWRPLVHLFLFSQSILQQQVYDFVFDRVVLNSSASFLNAIAEVKSFLSAGSTKVRATSKAFYFTIMCTAVDDILNNLPSVLEISGELPGFRHYLMNYFYHDQITMNYVSKLWPQMFSSGLGMGVMDSIALGTNAAKIQCTNLESFQHASFVFGSYLKETPFHLLFPAIIFCGHEYYSEIKELLIMKLSNLTAEQIVSSLQLVLFWFHQVQLSFRKSPSKQLGYFFEICFMLFEHILAQLSTLKVDSSSSANAWSTVELCMQEVSQTVFCHPSVFAALSCTFTHDCELSEVLLTDNSKVLLHYCRERICKPELHVFNVLCTTCDTLVSLCSGEFSLSAYAGCRESMLKAFRHLIQEIILIFKGRFTLWYRSQDITFLPVLYAILAVKRFISPIKLLELANWMLTGKKLSNSRFLETSSSSPICLAFSIACTAFDMLAEYLQPLNVKAVQRNFFWAFEEIRLDASLFGSIYIKAFEFATSLKLDLADVCLSKALNAARSLAYRQELLPLSMEMMRVIAGTPIKLLSHCIHKTNTTRANLLFLMIQISPLHLSEFGCLFLNILRGDLLRENSAARTNDQSLSDQEYLMLMPAAFLYINSSRKILREQSFINLECVLSLYSTMLVDGFRNWKCFVTSTVFLEEYGNFMPSSHEDLLDLFHCSLLGKAVVMLQWHFSLTGDNKSKHLELFCSIFPSSDVLNDFLDVDVGDVDSYSVTQIFNLVNRVIAKISLFLVLLFPESNDKCLSSEVCHEEDESVVGSSEEDSLRVRFLDMLVSIWQWVVKKLPPTFDNSVQKGTISPLLRSLEVFILRCIPKLTVKMHKHLTQMHSLPFMERLAKVSLLYRFGDPTTLETLRHILYSLSNGNLPVTLFLQLLLGHSQLTLTMSAIVESSNCTATGIVVNPISSFLKSLNFPAGNISSEKCGGHKGQLEVIKLLRLLFHLRVRQGSISDDELGVNWRELLLLLLPSYGATIREIDLEIYGILSLIESARGMDNTIIADLDYLWGSSALRVRKENGSKHNLLDGNMADEEKDCRRSQFRDNFPIDLKILNNTILYFPYERTISEKSLFSDSFVQDNIRCTVEEYSAEFGRIECYDPVFILSFSIHSLSMGYLDPVEFTSLGLLAIAIVSMTSPDDVVRKMGYEVLGRLTFALKASQKRREANRLRELLAYLQNGIAHPWQKIPSIAAVFVSEASVILLDPTHNLYPTISKILKKGSRINLESIPMFHDILWSSSMNVKSDRMWMLRLLCAGINSKDDGRIFIRNSVPETLLSVHASPFSNNEEKELILQVLKKCIKVQNVGCYLIEKCCLVSWLSLVLSLSLSRDDVKDIFSSKQMVVLLEVVKEIVSSESTLEWLEKYALEQLSDLSCQLFSLLVRCSKFVPETVSLVVLVLDIISSALTISQKRKMHQPHFTPSVWSLYQLYQAVDRFDYEESSQCAEHGLKVILKSIPPPATISEMGQQELSQFLTWTVATAVLSDSTKVSQLAVLKFHNKMTTEEHKREGSLVSTLLRWLVASVILWRVSCCQGSDSSFAPRRAEGESLLSLMENSKSRGTEEAKLSPGSKEVLATTIFYLQQLLGFNRSVLPSVVAALSILLLSDGSFSAGSATTTSSEILPSLWSKIRYPPEAYPVWRWSFDETSDDGTPEGGNMEKVEELHACQKLVVIILGKLRKESAEYQQLSFEELESSGLYEWERTNLVQQ